MSSEELDAARLPEEPKLSGFPLHTHDWRVAFLHELYMQGYPALFEGVARAWALMEEPKSGRCTYVGLLAGSGGKGKNALFNFFEKMIAEALSIADDIPPPAAFASLEAWNRAVEEQWKTEERLVDQVIEKYALLLVGRLPHPEPKTGQILPGPWGAPGEFGQ